MDLCPQESPTICILVICKSIPIASLKWVRSSTLKLLLDLSGHAVNSGMLKALGITHVVSVGETLSAETSFIHGHYVDAKDLASNCNNRRKLNVHDQAIAV